MNKKLIIKIGMVVFFLVAIYGIKLGLNSLETARTLFGVEGVYIWSMGILFWISIHYVGGMLYKLITIRKWLFKQAMYIFHNDDNWKPQRSK